MHEIQIIAVYMFPHIYISMKHLKYIKYIYFAVISSAERSSRKSRNVVAMGDCQILKITFKIIPNPGSNFVCWGIEIVADISALLTMKTDYVLAMALQIGLSCGVTPLVYIASMAMKGATAWIYKH